MCSIVLLRRPGHDWPLLLAANRDELVARASQPPGRHWPEWPEVIGGLDVAGGGSWLGLNDHGMVAAVLNREGTLGTQAGKRSRGELVLEALDHAEAGEAAGALADLHPDAYRPFNLIIADPRDAYWLRHGGDGEIRVHPIGPGFHMLTSAELDDRRQPRIRRYLPRFEAAAVPDPKTGDWAAWISLLRCRDAEVGAGATSAMTIAPLPVDGGQFATVASSLIAVPAYPGFHCEPVFLHAHGPPDRAEFVPVTL
jgi:uncharacterized protein with NRDE domain